MSQKRRGGWGEVNFTKDHGVVRKSFNGGGVGYQSMQEHDSFRSARNSADMLDMGSDQHVHVAVQRAFLRKK